VTVIAIAPRHNRPGINPHTRRPYRDADEFRREAHAFAQLHGGRVFVFDNHKEPAARFADVVDWLTPMRGIEAAGFFCHGLKASIQVGAGVKNAHVLAATLRSCGVRAVPLYACETARDLDGDRKDDEDDGPGGAGGFASVLVRALGGDCHVDAHTRSGHTSRLPFVRRFYANDDTDAGHWLVEPGSALWRTWKAALRDDRDFRLSFPLLSQEAIAAYLSARQVA